jgi:hypothetical protein
MQSDLEWGLFCLLSQSTIRYKEVKSKAMSYLDARLYSKGEQWGHDNNRHHDNNGHHENNGHWNNGVTGTIGHKNNGSQRTMGK